MTHNQIVNQSLHTIGRINNARSTGADHFILPFIYPSEANAADVVSRKNNMAQSLREAAFTVSDWRLTEDPHDDDRNEECYICWTSEGKEKGIELGFTFSVSPTNE